jgi:hypothetical protein
MPCCNCDHEANKQAIFDAGYCLLIGPSNGYGGFKAATMEMKGRSYQITNKVFAPTEVEAVAALAEQLKVATFT